MLSHCSTYLHGSNSQIKLFPGGRVLKAMIACMMLGKYCANPPRLNVWYADSNKQIAIGWQTTWTNTFEIQSAREVQGWWTEGFLYNFGYTDLDTPRLYTIEKNPWGIIQTPAALQKNVCQEETITWQLSQS